MKANDKEFYELREQFEKTHKKSNSRSSLVRAKRDENTPAGIFYDDWVTNGLFQMYMMGYENAKCLSRIGIID